LPRNGVSWREQLPATLTAKSHTPSTTGISSAKCSIRIIS
jgi:hypothetical protein